MSPLNSVKIIRRIGSLVLASVRTEGGDFSDEEGNRLLQPDLRLCEAARSLSHIQTTPQGAACMMSPRGLSPLFRVATQREIPQ